MSEMYEKIADNFNKNYNCCQVIFAYACSKLGFDQETAIKIAAAFGGGMGYGDTCGLVTGGLMALGLIYGDGLDAESKKRLQAAKEEFESRFKNKNGSLMCRNLLGLDFSKSEEKAQILESGLLKGKCPQMACDAAFILDRFLIDKPCELGVGCSCGNH